ncbi:yjgQ [Wigglesworthia glossinidia endosymbiont of Glossina brevipalpis]|uniref:YjgQ protein n=1 Tax=Wigglesworthia glossinidia brevipalpis TaxID=36870 RepID=Q8D297_WIGBR|nr:yjgQ [Wigglesworthia glossinidia endosymbiont of Glossina brevipalpis]
MLFILDRYIRSLIFKTTIVALFILLTISGIIKFSEKIQSIDNSYISIFYLISTILLSVPKDIEEFFNISILIGILWSIGILEKNRELIIIESSGISRIKICILIIKTIIIFLFIYSIILEWIIPIEKKIKSKYFFNFISENKKNLWIKINNNFILIKKIVDFDFIQGIYIYEFNKFNEIKYIKSSKYAIFKNKEWIMFDVKTIKFNNNKKIEINSFDKQIYTNIITPKEINLILFPTEELSISELYFYIKFLKKNNLYYKKQYLVFWNKIFSPISILIITIIILQLLFGILYSYDIKIKVVFVISLGFIFYFINNIFNSLIMIYDYPEYFGQIMNILFLLIISILSKKFLYK